MLILLPILLRLLNFPLTFLFLFTISFNLVPCILPIMTYIMFLSFFICFSFDRIKLVSSVKLGKAKKTVMNHVKAVRKFGKND